MKKINVLKMLENESIKQNEFSPDITNFYSGTKKGMKIVIEYATSLSNKILENRKKEHKNI